MASSDTSKRKIGPFELERKLGSGGMGVVYLASYAKTGQKVALKVLPPGLSADFKLLKRFEREIDILKKLQHPNIVRYFGGGKHGEQRFYAMELMDGGSLEDLIKKRGRLPWEQAIEFGKQICEALEHAHKHGVIHRDLKPANLFLTKSEKLKLGDFGIARDTQATQLTAAGKTVGTYAYMAPEQITGQTEVGPKTDLYALGCVLFEMLTGKPPFQAETQPEMLFQHIEAEPPRVRATAIDCPIWLDNLVQQLLAKDPQDRPFDALAVHTALEEIGQRVAQQASIAQQTAGGGPTALAVDAQDPELKKLLAKKQKKKKRPRGPVYERAWFLALCLAVVIGGIAWLMWPLGEDQLFQRAEALMQSDDPIQWSTAEEKYLDPLLTRFPDSRHAEKARAYKDRIAEDRALRRAETAARLNLEPRSSGEKHVIDALRAERDGDRLLALHRYRNLIRLLEAGGASQEDRPYVLIAQKKLIALQQGQGGEEDRRLIAQTLRKADELGRRGALREADELYTAVASLYQGKLEFQKQVDYALARLKGEDVEPIDFSDPEAAPTAEGTAPPEG